MESYQNYMEYLKEINGNQCSVLPIFPQRFKIKCDIINKKNKSNIDGKIDDNNIKGYYGELNFFNKIKFILEENITDKAKWFLVQQINIDTEKEPKKNLRKSIDFVLIHDDFGIFLVDSKNVKDSLIPIKYKEAMVQCETFKEDLFKKNTEFKELEKYMHNIVYFHDKPLSTEQFTDINRDSILLDEHITNFGRFKQWLLNFKGPGSDSTLNLLLNFKCFLMEYTYEYDHNDHLFKEFIEYHKKLKDKNAKEMNKEKLIIAGPAGSGKTRFLLDKIKEDLIINAKTDTNQKKQKTLHFICTNNKMIGIVLDELWKSSQIKMYTIYIYLSAYDETLFENVQSIEILKYKDLNIFHGKFVILKASFINRNYYFCLDDIDILKGIVRKLSITNVQLNIEPDNDLDSFLLKMLEECEKLIFLSSSFNNLLNIFSVFNVSSFITNVYIDDVMTLFDSQSIFTNQLERDYKFKIQNFWITIDLFQHRLFCANTRIIEHDRLFSWFENYNFEIFYTSKVHRYAKPIFDLFKSLYFLLDKLYDNQWYPLLKRQLFKSQPLDKLYDNEVFPLLMRQTLKSQMYNTDIVNIVGQGFVNAQMEAAYDSLVNCFNCLENLQIIYDIINTCQIEIMKKHEEPDQTYEEILAKTFNNTFTKKINGVTTKVSNIEILLARDYVDGKVNRISMPSDEYENWLSVSKDEIKNAILIYKNYTNKKRVNVAIIVNTRNSLFSEKTSNNFIEQLKNYVRELGEEKNVLLIDSKSMVNFYSLEYPSVIYILPYKNKNVRSNHDEIIELCVTSYFAISRAACELTIIYNECNNCRLKH